MKALAVLALLLGLIALLSWRSPGATKDAQAVRAVSVNYAVFREAAFRYALANPAASGDVPQASMSLPLAWKALRPWRARIEGGRCYVYGPATGDDAGRVRELLRGSYAAGWAAEGFLAPANPAGTQVALPAWISDGSVVSVISLN